MAIEQEKLWLNGQDPTLSNTKRKLFRVCVCGVIAGEVDYLSDKGNKRISLHLKIWNRLDFLIILFVATDVQGENLDKWRNVMEE